MVLGLDYFWTNLPYYSTFVFFLSYLVWLKFYKKERLSPNSFNDLSEILSIFFYIFANLIVGYYLFFSTLFIFKNYDLNSVWPITQHAIIFISIFIIPLFIFFYKHKEVSVKELRKLIESTMLIQLLFYFLYLGMWLSMFFNKSNEYVFLRIFNPFLILILILLIDIFAFYSLFRIILPTELFKKLHLFMIPFLLLCGFIVGNLLIPSITFYPIQYDHYEFNPDRELNTYLSIRVPLEISFSGISSITFNYSTYNFSIDGFAGQNFQLLINRSNDSSPIVVVQGFDSFASTNEFKKYGFSNIVIQRNGLITLFYDYQLIKNQNINKIVLDGYVKQNISSSDYFYNDHTNDPDVCHFNKCILNFDLTNHLNYPVSQNTETIYNNPLLNDHSCRFSTFNVTNITEENLIIIPNCNLNSLNCGFDIQDFISKEIIFRLLLVIDNDKSIVKRQILKFSKPLELNALFQINCGLS